MFIRGLPTGGPYVPSPSAYARAVAAEARGDLGVRPDTIDRL